MQSALSSLETSTPVKPSGPNNPIPSHARKEVVEWT